MARKSLSSQVLEELDRARGMLSSLQDSSDPIPAILIGNALESLHRIESMCLAARQSAMNGVSSGIKLVDVDVAAAAAKPAERRRSTSHKATKS